MQTRSPYINEPLHKCAPTDEGPLYRQGAHTDKGPLQTKNPYRRCVIPTDKGPLQTIYGPFRQGALHKCAPTDEGPLYRQEEPL